MEFKKLSNDDNLLKSGEWRLASVDEVKSNFDKIKRQGILETWSILRLLDGWVMGSGYGYELKQGCKLGMGEMLVVKTNTSDGSFKMLSRDANLISGQWRLASVDELKSNFKKIKSQRIVKEWIIVHLLDGWVTGSGYNYELKQGYKSGMSDMLVVNTNKLRPSNGTFDPEMYSGVELNAQGGEAALLLSVDDKITEVVYFALYLFAKDAGRLTELENLILKIKKDLGCDC
ncbi:hypothetical protein SUGI_1179930 [Cryptomeria japonica]|nr:hypothetical protein SUGI_1179930 [Cryptomeria japonica]